MWDDIYLNEGMINFWNHVQTEFKTYDLTSIGHFSGTGLIDYSLKSKID